MESSIKPSATGIKPRRSAREQLDRETRKQQKKDEEQNTKQGQSDATSPKMTYPTSVHSQKQGSGAGFVETISSSKYGDTSSLSTGTSCKETRRPRSHGSNHDTEAVTEAAPSLQVPSAIETQNAIPIRPSLAHKGSPVPISEATTEKFIALSAEPCSMNYTKVVVKVDSHPQPSSAELAASSHASPLQSFLNTRRSWHIGGDLLHKIKKYCCCKVLLLVCFLAYSAPLLCSTPLHSFFPLAKLCRLTYSDPLLYTVYRSNNLTKTQNHKYSSSDTPSGPLGPAPFEILELRKQLTFYDIEVSKIFINSKEISTDTAEIDVFKYEISRLPNTSRNARDMHSLACDELSSFGAVIDVLAHGLADAIKCPEESLHQINMASRFRITVPNWISGHETNAQACIPLSCPSLRSTMLDVVQLHQRCKVVIGAFDAVSQGLESLSSLTAWLSTCMTSQLSAYRWCDYHWQGCTHRSLLEASITLMKKGQFIYESSYHPIRSLLGGLENMAKELEGLVDVLKDLAGTDSDICEPRKNEEDPDKIAVLPAESEGKQTPILSPFKLNKVAEEWSATEVATKVANLKRSVLRVIEAHRKLVKGGPDFAERMRGG